MKDEQFAQSFALASAYSGLALAVFLMTGAVTMTSANTIAFFAGSPDQAATAVLAAPIVTPIPQAQAQAQAAAVGVGCAVGQALSLGAKGNSVACLQKILAQDPSVYPEGLVTGYFGPLTEAAVQRWQAAHNIVSSGDAESTGYGAVGPHTIASFGSSAGESGNNAGGTPPHCNGDTIPCNSAGTLSATPASGAAPLAVTFSTAAGDEESFQINFGDGSAVGQMSVSGGGAYRTATHTYTTANTYTAALIGQTQCGMTNSMPGTPIYCPTTVGTVTITVNGGSNGGGTPPSCNGDTVPCTSAVTLSAAPTSGAAPLAVQFTSNTAGTVNFGDGTSGNVTVQACTNSYPNPSCSYGITHTYTSAGTYHASITTAGSCNSGYCAQTASVTVTVSGSSSGSCPPSQPTTSCNGTWQQIQLASYATDSNACSIRWTCVPGATSTSTVTFSAAPTSGTAPLSVTFTSNTAGTVNFGDGTSGNVTVQACTNSIPGSCTYSATHTYSAANTYTATLSGQTQCGMTNSMPGTPIYCPTTLGTVTITVTGNTPSANDFQSNASLSDMAAAVVTAPFSLMVDSLTNIFVMLGVGQ